LKAAISAHTLTSENIFQGYKLLYFALLSYSAFFVGTICQ